MHGVLDRIRSLDETRFDGKRVLVRIDVNAPLDPTSGQIANDNRFVKSLPTIRELAESGARVVLIAHQGDSTDYKSLTGLGQHAALLAKLLGTPVDFIEDIAGPAAIERITALTDGDVLLLDNLRYLGEELSTFEDSVSLTAQQMTQTFLVRKLAGLFDYYVNDAFSAAHRNAPSMVAFQQLLPSFGGRLLMAELNALGRISDNPRRPCTYLLGGSRAGDAFGMIDQVLGNQTADHLLVSGLVGQLFMCGDDRDIGQTSRGYLSQKGYDKYIEQARGYLQRYRAQIHYPCDVAIVEDNERRVVELDALTDAMSIADIGHRTIAQFQEIIARSQTLFFNGPPGIYEQTQTNQGTREICRAVAAARGDSIIGGGDSVTAFTRFSDLSELTYVSTAGGALIRYLSGVELPLLTALADAKADNREQP